MSILKKAATIAGLVSVSFATQAVDTIHLKNGDKITGKIIEMGANTIKIDIDYAEEEIKIDWKDIATLETDDEVTILKSDSTRAKGRIESVKNGDITLAGATGSTFSLDDVTNMNPAPEGTYVGEGIFDLGGFLSTGNTEKGSLHAAAEYIYKNEVNRFTLGGTYDLAHDTGKESANNFRAYGQYDRFLDANWYVYGNADFTKDRFQDLDYRISAGAGLGYQFWDDTEKFLSLEAGPGYTYEIYSSERDAVLTGSGYIDKDSREPVDARGIYSKQRGADIFKAYEDRDKRSYVNARWAMDFHHWFLDESVQFFHNHEGIVSLANGSDLLIRTHTGARVPIFKGFNVLAQFDYDWKNIPAEGKDREDFRYIIGVGYSW